MAKVARNGLYRRIPSEAAWVVIDGLVEQGWSNVAIASAAGLPFRSIESAIVDRGSGQVRTFGAKTALAILNHGEPTTGKVGVHGARRRLRGLARQGWDLRSLAVETGQLASTLGMVRASGANRVRWGIHAAIRDAERRIGMTVGPSKTASKLAEAKGWPPLLAWDDKAIDDPHATPSLGANETGQDIDDIEWLIDCGGTWESIPGRLGITKEGVDRSLRRANRLDLIARLTPARAS